jgi:two-component system, OmpR family, phosphate regulon response regulator PhoB
VNRKEHSSERRRILLADGNVEVQKMVRQVAEKFGHELIEVTLGAAVHAVAALARPDVIVLDMVFPDADGRDVLARLKADPRTWSIPVVVWSDRATHDSDSRISLELGAEDYVEKTDAQLLVRKLDRVLLRFSA